VAPLLGIQVDLHYDPTLLSVQSLAGGAAAAQLRLDSNAVYQPGVMRVLFSPNGTATAAEGELFSATFCFAPGVVAATRTGFSLTTAGLVNEAGDLVAPVTLSA
jgi:hypothetical protein